MAAHVEDSMLSTFYPLPRRSLRVVSELSRDAWAKFDAGKKLLLVFVSLSQTYAYLGRENLNEENASIRLAHRQVCRA